MATHVLPIAKEDFERIFANVRKHVFVEKDAVVGDVVRAVEHDGKTITGREMVGTIISRVPLPESTQVRATVRWGVSSRSGSSSQIRAVALCECGHTQTLHEDAAGACIFCNECSSFKPA